MKRSMFLGLIATAFLIATMQSSQAIVWFTAIQKGKIPGLVQTRALRDVLTIVPPLGGTATEGSWNNCTLYYRGTQDDLQKILQRLSGLKKIALVVVFDKTGKAGRVESQKHRPLPGTLIYQFSISVGGHPFIAKDGGESVSITIHKSAGIDPDKLQIPKGVRVVTNTLNRKSTK